MKFVQPIIESFSEEKLTNVLSATAGCNSIGTFTCTCYTKCHDHVLVYNGGTNC